MKTNFDAIIVGGGLIGLSVAYGLARRDMNASWTLQTQILKPRGVTLALFGFRAREQGFLHMQIGQCVHQNFGLNYVMSCRNTRPLSCTRARWRIHICLSEEEFELVKLNLKLSIRIKMVNSNMKCLIEKPTGYSPVLGQMWLAALGAHTMAINPLYLLRSLHNCFLKRNGQLLHDAEVFDINHGEGVFDVFSRKGKFQAPCLVLAAGLGNRKLAPLIGLKQPVRPQKGQILVTQKIDKLIEVR